MSRITDIDDIVGEDFDDDSFLDDYDMEGFNLGYQAGTLNERERILRLLDTTRICSCKETCRTDINIYAFLKEELGVDLFKLIRGGDEQVD